MNYKYEKKQRLKFALIVAFLASVIGLIIANFLSFSSYQNMGVLTIKQQTSFNKVGIKSALLKHLHT